MKIIKILLLLLLVGLSGGGHAQTMEESFNAIQRGDSELPSVFRLPKGVVHATSFS